MLLTAAVCIVLPNVAAALFNWFYNRQLIVDFDERFAVELGPMLPTFDRVANCVNVIAFPLGTFLLIYFTLQVVRGLRKAEANQPATEQELAAAWNLGTRAAVIGGALWMLAGLIYPVVLSWLLPQFPWSMAFQFFSSLTLCGGVAWIYPFFGLTLIAVNVYYPRLVAVTMTDDNFAQRARALRMRMVIYLFSAAMIPLFTLFLMILVTERQHFLLMTVMVTAVGLSAAFAAYQRLDNTLRALDQVLEQS